ncbi:MAG: hypothetical protein AB1758_11280, partial [Candidatus Eremiobacterota bacterium]
SPVAANTPINVETPAGESETPMSVETPVGEVVEINDPALGARISPTTLSWSEPRGDLVYRFTLTAGAYEAVLLEKPGEPVLKRQGTLEPEYVKKLLKELEPHLKSAVPGAPCRLALGLRMYEVSPDSDAYRFLSDQIVGWERASLYKRLEIR